MAGEVYNVQRVAPSISLGATANVTDCVTPNGSIQLIGLDISVQYQVDYLQDASPVSMTLTSTAGGEINLTGLPAASYSNIQVTLEGMVSNQITGPVNIDDNTELPTISPSLTDNSHCTVPNGSAFITATNTINPVGNYTFNFYSGNTPVAPSLLETVPNVVGTTGYTFDTLAAGEYTIEVINNDLNCSDFEVITILENTVDPVIDVASVAILNVTSPGGSDGSIDASSTVTGGSGDYSYSWYAGLDTLGGVISTSPSLAAQSAGDYTLVVTDAIFGCQSLLTNFTIIEIDPLVVYNANDNGQSSLRDVIANAPASSTITFDTGFDWSTDSIAIVSQIIIDKQLTIDAESNQVTIQQTGTGRVFNMTTGSTGSVLRDLNITGGNTDNGAGVFVATNQFVDIVNTFISANDAGSSNGGGLYVDTDAVVNVHNSVFYGNQAQNGGGIYNVGNTILVNVTVGNNTAIALGGGIDQSGNFLDLINVTITENTADQYAGLKLTGVPGGCCPNADVNIKNTIVVGNNELTATGEKDLYVSNLVELDELQSGNNLIEETSTATSEFGPNSTTGVISSGNLDPVSMAGPSGLPHYPIPDGSLAVDAGDDGFLGVDAFDVDNDADVAETIPLDVAGNARIAGNEIDMGASESGFSAFFATIAGAAHNQPDTEIGPNETDQAFYVFTINPNGSATLNDVSFDLTGDGLGNVLGNQVGIHIVTGQTTFDNSTPITTATISGSTANFSGLGAVLSADELNYIWLSLSTIDPITDGQTIQVSTVSTINFVESVTQSGIATAGSIFTFLTPDGYPYCDPAGSFSSTVNPIITNVTFGSIDNNTGSDVSSYYHDFSGQSTSLVAGGQNDDLIITFDSNAAGGSGFVKVFADWDQDTNFETLTGPISYSGIDTLTLSLEAPDTATLGDTRLRIMTYTVNEPFDGGCSQFIADGEVEDYTITVLPKPIATFTTLPVSGGNVTQGDTDVLIYKMQMDVSIADVMTEGLFVTLGGTADSADFVNDQFQLRYNETTDDFASATLLGGADYGNGSPIPTNGVGWFLQDTFAVGSSTYFYITADLELAAAVGDNFFVETPGSENFGVADADRDTSALTNGPTFDIQAFDAVNPTVAITTGASDPTNTSSIAFTLTFSEEVDGFAVSDLTIGNGTASNLLTSDSTTFTVDVTPTADGLVTLDMGAGVATDQVGNGNDAATQFSITYDATNPTLLISTAESDPTGSSPIVFTITFDEEVDGFADSDLTIGNGTAGNLSTSDSIIFTVDVTPTADGLVTVDIGAGVATDQAGNGNDAATQFSITYDSTNPAVLISTAESDPTGSSPIVFTITFDEEVDGFADSDLTIGNGTASNLSTSDSTVFTVDVTPTADGLVTLDIGAGVATDQAGNGNAVATQFSITYDATNPAVSISTAESDPTGSSPIVFTITFDEEVDGVADSDLTIGNGTASNLSTSDSTIFTVDVTPVADGLVTVDIGAGVATDQAGNGNSAATQFSITYDATNPSVLLSSVISDTTNQSPIAIDILFDEAVSGFELADLVLVNATASNLATADSISFTLDLTPTSEGALSVNVAAASVVDPASNLNSAGTALEFVYDMTLPIVGVDVLLTNIASPELTGSVDDNTASISVDVDGNTYVATNNGDGTWTLGAGIISPDLVDGVYEVTATATDIAGNADLDGSSNELTVDLTAPVVTVTELFSTDDSPALTGTIDDENATLVITVNGINYNTATINTGTWTLADNELSPLADGIYNVLATATDQAGNIGTDATNAELRIDASAPVVTVNVLATNDNTPALSGTISDSTASVEVTIDGSSYSATNNQDGTWLLADDLISPALADGFYDVMATATDTLLNADSDATNNELFIDATAPVVTVTSVATEDNTPALLGTVDDPNAAIQLTVDGQNFNPINLGDGNWSLADNTVSFLNVGRYDVQVTATDTLGNQGNDGTTEELTISPRATTALDATDISISGFTANWSSQQDVLSYLLDVSDQADFSQFIGIYNGFSTDDTTRVVNGLDYNSSYYYRVRVIYNSNDTSDFSNTIATLTATDPGTALDSLALVAIYDSTDGDNWTNKANWKEGRLRTWAGVTMFGTRVTAVDLAGNNLSGAIGDVASGLDQVTTLTLTDNEITAIGDLTVMSSLTQLNVADNRLQFGTIESLIALGTGIDFGSQKKVLDLQDVLAQQGSTFTADRTVSGSANTYSWFRNDVAISGDGPTINIQIESFEDEGVFRAEVTNTNVSGLTIVTEDIILKVSSLQRDSTALIAIFDALGGDTWTRGSDWKTTDISQWSEVGITNSRVTSLDLSNNNMFGEVPADINDIAGLATVNLSQNPGVTGVPDMTSLSDITSLNLDENALDFADLEPNAGITGVSYANQNFDILQPSATLLDKGSEHRVEVSVAGSANHYSWIRTNDASGAANVGSDAPLVEILELDYETMGIFEVSVTNDLVPGLTLRSQVDTVYATADIEFTPLYSDLLGNDAQLDEGEATLLKVTAPGVPFDSVETIAITSQNILFDDVILANYLLAIRTDTLLLRTVDGQTDSVQLLPTYFSSTFLWEEADTLKLRDFISDDLRMQQRPRPLPPIDNGSVVGMNVESNFAEETPEGRVSARRRVRRAGCSLSKRRSSGRPEEDIFDLIAYKETDDEGRVVFENLPPGTYRVNIQYPGIPMDPNSFVEFAVGEDGVEDNQLELAATVSEDGIVVELVEELGFYRKYFKDLTVYPNPASEYMKVSYSKLMSDNVVMRLMNLSGKVIHEEELRKGYNQSFDVNVSEIEGGVYLLNFYDPTNPNGTVVTLKVIVKH
ncbi:MAG: hypothetical protein KI790_15040 [Cyclobacteriaceae bacterium]|nr:hypothetical protein [Cyclobacteriaceae bacterium HetDA_MAG_MS6]